MSQLWESLVVCNGLDMWRAIQGHEETLFSNYEHVRTRTAENLAMPR